jgi:hypothetical protein
MRATMAGLPRRISKLLSKPLKARRASSQTCAVQTLTVLCSNDHSTDDVLAQLQDVSQNRHVTCVILKEMIQRSDNIQLFTHIHDLLRESKYFTNVQSIRLVEPHVYSDEYRRWCFKKTNFLHRIQREAKERHIDVSIDGTLILDNHHNHETCSDSLSQNVSSWLSLLQQLPKDPDITSLWIYLKEEAVVHTGVSTGRRPSQLDLLQSPVQKVFQALVELFNADTRHWKFIHTHVLYHPHATNESIQEEKTQALLDVAELYHIPLQVQWQAIILSSPSPVAHTPIRTRATSAALQKGFVLGTSSSKGKEDEDNTSTTVGMDGSSGALTAGGQPK